MFGLFKFSSKKEKLEKKRKKLLSEAFKLSHTNRKASDQKMVEAEELARIIESIK